MNVENLSSEELFTLANRKKLEEEKANKPKIILNRDSSVNLAMIYLAEGYLQEELDGREIDTQWAYELIMKSVFGNDIFTYIDNNL